jgi:hypothetical protein
MHAYPTFLLSYRIKRIVARYIEREGKWDEYVSFSKRFDYQNSKDSLSTAIEHHIAAFCMQMEGTHN